MRVILNMTDKVKILFLAANPVDAASRQRLDEEFREIGAKIRIGTLRDRLELVSEWAVRAGDLQQTLLRHQPDIVHFSGRTGRNQGIALEDNSGNSKAINKRGVADLFKILKDNIRVVVLNGCYAKQQAEGLVETIDYTVGMGGSSSDKAAIVFAAHFYQGLAFGRTVQEAFDLAVNQLAFEGIRGAKPNLITRNGAAESRIVQSRTQNETEPGDKITGKVTTEELAAILRRFISNTATDDDRLVLQTALLSGEVTRAPSAGDVAVANGQSNIVIGGDAKGAFVITGGVNMHVVAASAEYDRLREAVFGRRFDRRKRIRAAGRFIPLLLAATALSLITDVAGRSFASDGDWLDVTSTILLGVLIATAIIAVGLMMESLFLPELALMEKVAGIVMIRKRLKPKMTAVLAAIALVIALGLELSLPVFADLYMKKGIQFQHGEQRDLARSLELYRRAVRLQPSHAQAHYHLGTVYEELQSDNAIEEYSLAIKYDKQFQPPRHSLVELYNKKGDEYHEQGDVSGAVEFYKLALNVKPSDAVAHYNLAAAYEDLHQHDEAIEEYNFAIKYDGNFVRAYNNLARLYLSTSNNREDHQRALELLRHALNLSPQNEEVRYSLFKNFGWASYLLGNYVLAEQYLRNAIELRKDKAAAHCLLAYMLKRLGRTRAAAAECYSCVSLSYDEKDVEKTWLTDAQEGFAKGECK